LRVLGIRQRLDEKRALVRIDRAEAWRKLSEGAGQDLDGDLAAEFFVDEWVQGANLTAGKLFRRVKTRTGKPGAMD
jgi:hypothetical protein